MIRRIAISMGVIFLCVSSGQAQDNHFVFIDLNKSVNRGFYDEVTGDSAGGWTDFGSTACFYDLGYGIRTFQDEIVPFKIIGQFMVRAFENALAVAMANYAPDPISDSYNGSSCVFNARGEKLLLAGERERIYFAEIDLGELRKYRSETIYGNAFRRPHKYELLNPASAFPVALLPLDMQIKDINF
jgi:hypothetical protein